MAWYEITDAEVNPRQPIDSELMNKYRANLYIGLGSLGTPRIIPNGSFELATGVVPLLWETSFVGNGAATISTGAHGANSFKLTKTTGATSGAYAYTEDYIPVASTNITIHGIIWATGATVGDVKGGIVVRSYTGDYTTQATNVVYNTTGWTANPTTYSMVTTFSSLTRWIKIGCVCGTDCTVAGGMFFDGLYINNT